MPLIEELDLATEEYLQGAAMRAAQAAAPPKPLEPLLEGRQEPVRLSPQPDRLIRVQAAASPLFEAARPVVEALAQMSVRLGMEQADVLHAHLTQEVASFESICQDAGIAHEYSVGASYALCTALDEAANDALVAQAGESADPSPWVARSLAVRFHGDNKGGAKVFRLIGFLVNRAPQHIDMLELMFVILRLGFEGGYRHASNGGRELDDMTRRIYTLLSAYRQEGSADVVAHWRQIEHVLEHAGDPSAAEPPTDFHSP